MDQKRLTHLRQLEAESIHIIREWRQNSQIR
ncbi:sulfate adenylyltransferase [Escherichia coli]|nr:sulfate adenylyltransferase [Escherichia coli]